MKVTKILTLAVVAMFLCAFNVCAEDCVDCGKNACDTPTWACPSSDQGQCSTVDPCDVIFDICECVDDAHPFDVNDVIGAKMEIVTPGFYWTADAINLYLYNDEDEACADIDLGNSAGDGFDTGAYVTGNYIYEDADGDTGDYSDAESSSSTDCSVAAADMFTVVQAGTFSDDDDYTNDEYAITQTDVDEERHYWRLTVPKVVGNWSELEALAGTQATIKVQLIDLASGEQGLCAECDIVCTCEVYINICSDSEYCMYIPYVLQNEDNWATGFAVTNLNPTSTPMAQMEYTVTLIDAEGDEFSVTLDSGLDLVNTHNVDSIIADEGWDVAEGPAMIRVTANFPVDGYTFNLSTGADMVFGAGVLPRLDYDCDDVDDDAN